MNVLRLSKEEMKERYESYINVFERKIPYEEWVKEAKK